MYIFMCIYIYNIYIYLCNKFQYHIIQQMVNIQKKTDSPSHHHSKPQATSHLSKPPDSQNHVTCEYTIPGDNFCHRPVRTLLWSRESASPGVISGGKLDPATKPLLFFKQSSRISLGMIQWYYVTSGGRSQKKICLWHWLWPINQPPNVPPSELRF